MRVLLDEQLPRQLAPYLVGHEARTVQQQGWAGFKNGELLKEARTAGFDIFLTADQDTVKPAALQISVSHRRARMATTCAAGRIL